MPNTRENQRIAVIMNDRIDRIEQLETEKNQLTDRSKRLEGWTMTEEREPELRGTTNDEALEDNGGAAIHQAPIVPATIPTRNAINQAAAPTLLDRISEGPSHTPEEDILNHHDELHIRYGRPIPTQPAGPMTRNNDWNNETVPTSNQRFNETDMDPTGQIPSIWGTGKWQGRTERVNYMHGILSGYM
jgi:hypothetical protein